MRSCSVATAPRAARVSSVKESTTSPPGPCQRSYSPRSRTARRCGSARWNGRRARAFPCHSKKPSAGTRQRRRRRASRNAGRSCTPSTRALIMRAPADASFAQRGTRPQRRSSSTRSPVERTRTIGSSCVGAAFQCGASAGALASPKCSATSAAERVSVKRPHMASSQGSRSPIRRSSAGIGKVRSVVGRRPTGSARAISAAYGRPPRRFRSRRRLRSERAHGTCSAPAGPVRPEARAPRPARVRAQSGESHANARNAAAVDGSLHARLRRHDHRRRLPHPDRRARRVRHDPDARRDDADARARASRRAARAATPRSPAAASSRRARRPPRPRRIPS